MKIPSWLKALKGPASRRPIRRSEPRGARRQSTAGKLAVENLDQRIVPAFLTPVDYATGSYPYSLVSGDFNNDTVLDLAVANYSGGNVSVLLGNGDGTFQDAVSSTTGTYPLSIAAGDFNNDDILDIATANVYDVSVLLGNGDGTFGSPTSLGVVGNPTSVAVGDFTGDGVMDLGVTSNYYYWETYANVLVGDGAGNFSGPNSTWMGYGNFSSATAANLDGVGPDELVTANTYYGY
ncbi:MAG TPA: VCBS repeat-containing protein, partial [Gemmata sp.]|nr:VCBS repeat-containing protein [Gemmata sp.]